MFQMIEISIGGKTYQVKPTMNLIRALELADCGPFRMAQLLREGQPAFATYADLVATVARYAGAEVTADELYHGLTEQDRVSELYDLARDITFALIPHRPTKALEADTPKKRTTRTISRSGTKRQSST